MHAADVPSLRSRPSETLQGMDAISSLPQRPTFRCRPKCRSRNSAKQKGHPELPRTWLEHGTAEMASLPLYPFSPKQRGNPFSAAVFTTHRFQEDTRDKSQDSLSPDDVQDADEKGQLPKGCHRKRGFGRTGLLASVQCDSTSLFFEACKCKECLTRRNTLMRLRLPSSSRCLLSCLPLEPQRTCVAWWIFSQPDGSMMASRCRTQIRVARVCCLSSPSPSSAPHPYPTFLGLRSNDSLRRSLRTASFSSAIPHGQSPLIPRQTIGAMTKTRNEDLAAHQDRGDATPTIYHHVMLASQLETSH
jgi:hypothetical protein